MNRAASRARRRRLGGKAPNFPSPLTSLRIHAARTLHSAHFFR